MHRLIIALLAGSLAGCSCGDDPPAPGAMDASGVSAAPSPFITDRVLEVRVELEPAAWAQMMASPEEEAYQHANLVFDGTRLENIAVRTKGNSSLGSVKRMGSHRFSFKLDLDEYVDGQELMGVDKLVFDNGFKDPTLLREALAYEIARSFGLEAPRTAFVDLWMAGEHLGLYTLVEVVGKEFLERSFADDGGDLYKLEPQAGFLGWMGTTIAGYSGLEVERNEDTTDHAAFLRLVEVLHSGAADQYDGVLDVQAVLRYLAFDSALVNLDSYLGMGHNYYLYEQADRFSVIPWDLNEAFGNFTCGCSREGLIGLYIDEPTCGATSGYPLLQRLFAVPANLERYHGYLQELVDGPLQETRFGATVDALADLVRPYVLADTTKFFSNEDFERGLSQDVGSSVIGLRAFASERGAAIRAQMEGRSPATNGGRGSCGGGPRPCPPNCSDAGAPSPCGDGVCDSVEQRDPRLCPRDCADAGMPSPCGDGVCDSVEQRDPRLCPRDCADAGTR
ncbi:MAG: CotH kinase family protein [Deltaproteobacteria bacterium]|nr:CotH kinase family protein [Deltaproteobacteria bacterium]